MSLCLLLVDPLVGVVLIYNIPKRCKLYSSHKEYVLTEGLFPFFKNNMAATLLCLFYEAKYLRKQLYSRFCIEICAVWYLTLFLTEE